MEESRHIPDTVQKKGEFTLRELIGSIVEWCKFLLSKWLVILIAAIIGGGMGWGYSLIKKTNYVAGLSFVLEEAKSNSLGAYAGIASQFGLDLSGAGSSGVFSQDNIMGFLKSRLMVQKTLLTSVKVNNKETTLADLYLDIYEMRDAGKNNPVMHNLSFLNYPGSDGLSIPKDSVLNVIFLEIVKNNLTVSKPDKKLSFIEVKCVSQNELFSKEFTERLVKEATDFYIETKTKRSKSNLDKLQLKADSIETLLNKKTYSAAASQDLNVNPARRVAVVGTEVVMRDKMILQTMYSEVVKNLEMSRMSMLQETPLIQVVDTPILPLKKEKLGKLKGMVIGGIVGAFLVVLYLLFMRLYRNAMK